MNQPLVFERSLASFDGLRLRLFQHALTNAPLRTILIHRDRRVAIATAVHASVTFVVAIYYPVLLFVLGPILLGVAHVAADIRYLVLRQHFSRWWRVTLLAGAAFFFGLRLAEGLHWRTASARTELELWGFWAALAILAAAPKARRGRVAGALVIVAVITAFAVDQPSQFRVVFAHAHNLVALAVWPLFYRTRMRLLRLTILGAFAAAVVLASGLFYESTLASPGVRAVDIHVLAIATVLAPFARADFAIGVTSAFVFLQALHYFVWLNVIPQGDQPGQGTNSFRQTWRSLFDDLGGWGVALTAACMLLVWLGAVWSPGRAATNYMALATFHGYLELVVLLYFWVAGAPLSSRLRA
jgi:hypothetical protein